MKNLADLINRAGIYGTSSLRSSEVKQWGGTKISGITDDSRKVKPGYLFVAIKGLEHDGHDFIAGAIERGAVAILYSDNLKFKDQKSKLQIRVKNLVEIEMKLPRRALGLLWSSWYNFPSEKLKVIGITGTDGKTTTTNLLYHILKTAGRKVGMISTINARFGDREIDTGFHVTNPEPELLQRLLSEMVKEGLEYVCLEVTSHGIDQERIAGVMFYGAVITNVTHEHLDYHKTYQNYLETKGKLFKDVNFSVLNADDGSLGYLKAVVSGQLITYGINNEATVFAKGTIYDQVGSTFHLVLKPNVPTQATTLLYSNVVKGESEIEVSLQIPGVYNVSNALAASSAALELGLTLSEIKSGLESFYGLEGRFEEIKMGQPFKVVIDFAHTPNALENVLTIASQTKRPSSRLLCVFGCAGERDREKRQMMGEISGRIADASVLTAEDPRRENLNDIINQIANGCLKSGAAEIFNFQSASPALQRGEFSISNSEDSGQEKHFFVRVLDRRQAIETALKVAKAGDIVIITGKGHEKSMCFGTTEYPWSDQNTIREILDEMGNH